VNIPYIKKKKAITTSRTDIPPIGYKPKSLALIIKPEAHTANAKNGIKSESQLNDLIMRLVKAIKPSLLIRLKFLFMKNILSLNIFPST